jgi:hypothetical protein
MWNIRPVGGPATMLLLKLGCSPHFMQGGEVGF